MVFLVFLEVLEMSLEVVGPGPNTREIESLRVDPGPRACALPPDAGCMLPFGLFVVLCVGGFLQGRRLGGLRAVLAVPSVVPVLVQHLQDSTLSRWYWCDSMPSRIRVPLIY